LARRRKNLPSEKVSAPDESALRAALAKMLAWQEEWDNITLGHRKQREFWLLWGLIAHSIAQAQAALVLVDDPRLSVCGEVNARVALEHALLAQYVHAHPDGIAQLEQLLAFHTRTLAESLKDFPTQDPELAEFLEDTLSHPRVKRPAIGDIGALLREFDPTGTLYVPYKLLCQTAHPSSSTITRYLVIEEGQRPQHMRQVAPPEDKRPVLWAITLAVLLALGVQEDLRRTKPNKARLRSVAASVSMAPLLDLASANSSRES